MPVVVLPAAAAGEAERLTRVARGDDVHRADGGPVDGGDVPQVGHVRPAVGEDAGGCGVDLDVRGHVGVEHLADGHVQAPGAAEQGQHPGPQHVVDGELPGDVVDALRVQVHAGRPRACSCRAMSPDRRSDGCHNTAR